MLGSCSAELESASIGAVQVSIQVLQPIQAQIDCTAIKDLQHAEAGREIAAEQPSLSGAYC